MSMFIVLEGLDGAGTTTQTQRVAEWLTSNGAAVHTTREPSDGPVGKMIRRMLSGELTGHSGEPIDRETLALLFAADRVHHVVNEIQPALEAGRHVISDRYYHSSFAYQGDVDGEEHFDIDWVRALNARARTPDLTFFLSVPVETCLRRLGERGQRDIYETRQKLDRLAKRYDQVVATLLDEGERIVVVDGALSVGEVTEQIVGEL